VLINHLLKLFLPFDERFFDLKIGSGKGKISWCMNQSIPVVDAGAGST
jgi:hypothetical protein